MDLHLRDELSSHFDGAMRTIAAQQATIARQQEVRERQQQEQTSQKVTVAAMQATMSRIVEELAMARQQGTLGRQQLCARDPVSENVGHAAALSIVPVSDDDAVEIPISVHIKHKSGREKHE